MSNMEKMKLHGSFYRGLLSPGKKHLLIQCLTYKQYDEAINMIADVATAHQLQIPFELIDPENEETLKKDLYTFINSMIQEKPKHRRNGVEKNETI